MAYQPIENYGIIGNMRTAALVSIKGSIDWFCSPHFASPGLFAAILDDDKSGRVEIAATPAAATISRNRAAVAMGDPQVRDDERIPSIKVLVVDVLPECVGRQEAIMQAIIGAAKKFVIDPHGSLKKAA